MAKINKDGKKKDIPELVVEKSDYIDPFSYAKVFLYAAGYAFAAEIVIYLGAAICEVFHWIWLFFSCNLEDGSAFGKFWSRPVFNGMTATIWGLAFIIAVFVAVGMYRSDRKNLLRANNEELKKRRDKETKKRRKELEQHEKDNAQKFKEAINDWKLLEDKGTMLIEKHQIKYSPLGANQIEELTESLYLFETTLGEAEALADAAGKNGGI